MTRFFFRFFVFDGCVGIGEGIFDGCHVSRPFDTIHEAEVARQDWLDLHGSNHKCMGIIWNLDKSRETKPLEFK